MAHIALFHSVLGITPGVRAAADLLRDAGHTVTVPDLFDGATFDDYETGSHHTDQVIGMPALTAAAIAAVEGLPPDLVVAGFSNGGMLAEWVAAHRPVGAVVLLSGILPLAWFGELAPRLTWPRGVPVQSHSMREDPWYDDGAVELLATEVAASGAELEHHWYDGTGHLLTDASRPDEYDPAAADLLWSRVTAFLDQVERADRSSPGDAST